MTRATHPFAANCRATVAATCVMPASTSHCTRFACVRVASGVSEVGTDVMPNLCEAINALVEERLHEALETGEIINVPDMVSEMAESLAARIISSAPPEERSRLVAHLLTRLHYFLLEKREVSGV